MKPEQQCVLKQLGMAIERAYPHVHAPLASDNTAYLNMIELRGYLDALSDALEANSNQAKASGSLHRSLRASVCLYGRLRTCKEHCIEFVDALARRDEEKLHKMIVKRQEPIQRAGESSYGDTRQEKEEDKEYFTQLDSLLTTTDRYIEIMIAKWKAYFSARRKKAGKPEELDRPDASTRTVLPIKPKPAIPIQPALPLPVSPARKKLPTNPPWIKR